MDLKGLSDSELKEQLRKHGVNPGPILPTTRTIYEKKLQQLLEEKQVKENGGGHEDQYSDSEDEGVQVKNLMGMRCELNGDKTSGFDNYSQKNIPACLAAEFNQNLATLGDDFSVTKMLQQMERRSSLGKATGYRNGQESKNLTSKSQHDDTSSDFSDLLSQSALGMSATRRKPIKGAAGRPIQYRYDDIATKARMQEQSKETVTEGKPQRLVSVRLQILIFVIVAFVALVYITMESSPENPFNPVSEDIAEVPQP